ncbi:MAG TPA: putative glycoside hydrolase, partial [Patescibacteria group bacterium]|nr:putative glycoside hydrolase [Patescibacteria group bacterium]
GVFYDNTWDSLVWFTGKEVDINGDGLAEGTNANTAWREGMRQLFNATRRLAGNQYILVGNAITREYGESLNGIMVENMQNNRWREVMNAYRAQSQGGARPRVIIMNGNTSNTGDNTNYRLLRFTLASTLLGDGYFSYDYGDRDHGQVWWYDEYNINLGEPTGEAYSVGGATPFNEDVWRRDYAHGLTIVNATGEAQTVDLGAEYEKIIGTQDPVVNDGQITDKVNLSGKDGLLLLKTARAIDEVVFENGAFLRFLDTHGNRVRNGFFVFEEGLAGEARVWRGDLNGETGLEKISTEGGKMNIFNSQGDYWYNDSPFGVQYLGGINMAVGELNNESKINLVTTPASGGTVNLYNYYGGVLRQEFYPLGRKYRGSFSPAIGQVQAGPGNILLGVGKGRSAEVLVYDNNLTKLIRRFYPYESGFIGGVNVAAGDVNGDGLDEIITVPVSGRRPLVRVFNGRGKKLSEFYLSAALGGQNITLAAADVNYDGVEEIVVMSK